jgi:hypothetical protein
MALSHVLGFILVGLLALVVGFGIGFVGRRWSRSWCAECGRAAQQQMLVRVAGERL